jgi:hypothetical protein
MTPSEFRAWFEGFTEDMTGAPNKKQWERIKDRVGEITGQTVSYPVYIDRYVAPVRPYWDRVWCGVGGSVLGSAGGGIALAAGNTGAQGLSRNASFDQSNYNSHDAMNAVGRAEALAMKAA